MEAFDRDLTDTLTAFPIFKLAGSASPEQRAEPAFTGLRADCKLPPPGTDAALLGPGFLAQPLPGEAEVLRQRLGVPQVSQTSFLTEHIFPRHVKTSLHAPGILSMACGAELILQSRPAIMQPWARGANNCHFCP